MHSALSVGFDKAKMMGRLLSRPIASTTCREKALPTVLTPMMAVGLIASTAAAKSLVGACACAYGCWKSARSARLRSISPWTSKRETRARACSSLSPSVVMAETIRLAMPMPAEPAPKNRILSSARRVFLARTAL